MSNLPSGKGMYLWMLLQCESGNPDWIARIARAANLGHVFIKIADGIDPYNSTTIKPVIAALRAADISVWGWQYTYGGIWISKDGSISLTKHKPELEAQAAANLVKSLRLDGFVIDAEREYKTVDQKSRAMRYVKTLRAALPGTTIGLASYRYPSYHPQFPWAEFRSIIDFDMPQCYWEQAHNPAQQLKWSFDQFAHMKPVLPYIPTGASYKWNGWVPSLSDHAQFIKAADDMKLPAVNYWSWQHARRDLPKVWDLISNYPWAGHTQPPPISSPPQEPPTIKGWRLKAGMSGLNVRERAWRTGPAPKILWTLLPGETVYLGLERDGSWARTFVMSDGRPSGWLRADFLEKA